MSKQRNSIRVALVLAVFLVGYVDYATGYEFSVVLCYFIPIAITAWYESWRTTTVVALLSGVVWFASDYLTGATHSREFYRYWDGIVKIATFIIVGRTIYRTKQTIRERDEVDKRLQAALAEVRGLRELIAVCPDCSSKGADQAPCERTGICLGRHAEEAPGGGNCTARTETASKTGGGDLHRGG
jgi:hypothetical protein